MIVAVLPVAGWGFSTCAADTEEQETAWKATAMMQAMKKAAAAEILCARPSRYAGLLPVIFVSPKGCNVWPVQHESFGYLTFASFYPLE